MSLWMREISLIGIITRNSIKSIKAMIYLAMAFAFMFKGHKIRSLFVLQSPCLKFQFPSFRWMVISNSPIRLKEVTAVPSVSHR